MGFLSALFNGGNYGLIARNVAAFHETLRMHYQARMPDYRALLICAGLMDATVYIARGEIAVGDIVAIADESLGGKTSWPADKESMGLILTKYVIWLEILMFTVDCPSHLNIGEGVMKRGDQIADNILKVLDQYSNGCADMTIELAAEQWMTSPDTALLREELGIR